MIQVRSSAVMHANMRLFRLFQLLDTLRVRRTPVTARFLADEMGVSLRTLYRDIADLQAMGAPIRGEGGVGYVLESGYFLPSMRFDEEELSALAIGLRLAATRSDARLSEAAQRATAKIASAVTDDARLFFLDTPLEAGPTAAAPLPLLPTLRKAIQHRRKLQIDYERLDGVQTTRLARPLGLTVFDSVWLLSIWCETADDFRHLRVDRIGRCEETGETFRHEWGKRFSDCVLREKSAPSQ